jgi:hypothetical protein
MREHAAAPVMFAGGIVSRPSPQEQRANFPAPLGLAAIEVYDARDIEEWAHGFRNWGH